MQVGVAVCRDRLVDKQILMLFSEIDLNIALEPRDWQTLVTEIRRWGTGSKVLPATRRLLNHIQPLPRTLNTLANIFISATTPYRTDFTVLWGLAHLNTQVSHLDQVSLALG